MAWLCGRENTHRRSPSLCEFIPRYPALPPERPGRHFPDTCERPGRRPMGAPPYAHAACARVSATPPPAHSLTHTVPGKKHAVHISPTLMQCREDPDQALS